VYPIDAPLDRLSVRSDGVELGDHLRLAALKTE
jgi:hypothetical protein